MDTVTEMGYNAAVTLNVERCEEATTDKALLSS